MRCFATPDIVAWLERHAAVELVTGTGATTELFASAPCCRCGDVLPAAQTYPVANAVVQWLLASESASVLAVVYEYGVWGASENLALYARWRSALGIASWLEDEPGHHFQRHEHHEIASLLQMALCFGWGVVLVSDHREAFAVNHDGHTVAFSEVNAPQRAQELATRLAAYG